ncbi:OPT6 [Candida pseudojiufengensis]|uniref:OPT6 n=1 Tax=Candida pseudojiufengensis TaxID=497109 RepID=UPI0022255C01|nr:OPT6 [Candida pseudojiufengensis]KAI5965582.1 OPT6 [Candida pseudojiufengensis]
MKNQDYIELQQYPDHVDKGQVEGLLNEEGETKDEISLTETQLSIVLHRLGYNDFTYMNSNDIQNLPRSTKYMVNIIDKMSIDNAIEIIRNSLADHSQDVNFPKDEYNLLEKLLHSVPNNSEPAPIKIEEDTRPILNEKSYLNIVDWNLQVRLEATLIHYHSPYPEVRAITEPYDDPELLCETFRAYFIGFSWTFIGSIINTCFVHRIPNISLSSHTVQVLLLPCGKLWARYMPNKKIKLFSKTIHINPGPWTYKELMLSTIIYSCSSGVPYSMYNIFVMKLDKFYGLKWVTITFQIFLSISTQFLGFSFAMVMKKVCVYPSTSIWPSILPTIALNKALMDEEDVTHYMSRFKFFIIVAIFSFFYNWMPSYFFKALANFNWTTWFAPLSIHLVNVTGSSKGLGLNPWPTFDWNRIDAGGCLTLPFYSYVNRYLGSILGFLVILLVYYTNHYYSSYFPINSNYLFNNKAKVYDIHSILNEKNQFDDKKYQEVGPPYFSAANLVIYGAHFCLYPFSILYNFATEWNSMKSSFVSVWISLTDAFKSSSNRFGRYSDDPHCKMMSKYDEVPDWWFLTILVVSTSFAIATVIFYDVETPLWGIFLVIFINFIFLIPLTSIASVTGFSFGLNVLIELIVGYLIPNSGLALITLKAFGYNIDSQASNYITDQKLAHYTHLPPKAVFKGQIISTLINIAVALIITNWLLDSKIPDLCQQNQKYNLECPGANTYFYSSIQYGEIGPAKVFKLYPIFKWCFLLGAILVIPCALFKKYGPKKLTTSFQPTIIIGGFLDFAPYNLSYFTGGLYMSYLFMYKLKNNYLHLWERYNYILSSGLTVGVATSSLIIFFMNPPTLHWWGNNVSYQGIEGGKFSDVWKNATSAPDGYIGLRKGDFP